MHEPGELSYATCRGLLTSGSVGRAAVTTPDGPRIFTVNYSVVDEAILFRTRSDSVLGTYARDAAIAFQVDKFDYESQRGWSVMAIGRGEVVDETGDMTHIRTVWEPQPWAAGERRLFVRIAWTKLSGRQLGLGWDPKSELPARPND